MGQKVGGRIKARLPSAGVLDDYFIHAIRVSFLLHLIAAGALLAWPNDDLPTFSNVEVSAVPAETP